MAALGIPVKIVESGGVPIRPVNDKAPLMTESGNANGLPITIDSSGTPFVVRSIQGDIIVGSFL